MEKRSVEKMKNTAIAFYAVIGSCSFHLPACQVILQLAKLILPNAARAEMHPWVPFFPDIFIIRKF
jgi:hypothetical protein